jgi:hypothetical protein
MRRSARRAGTCAGCAGRVRDSERGRGVKRGQAYAIPSAAVRRMGCFRASIRRFLALGNSDKNSAHRAQGARAAGEIRTNGHNGQ